MAEDAEHIIPEGTTDDIVEDAAKGGAAFGDTSTWQGWFEKNVVLWAATDPYGFLRTIILVLTPFFIVSGILSYVLLKDIEKREKDKKRKSKKDANTLRARGKPVKSKHKKSD